MACDGSLQSAAVFHLEGVVVGAKVDNALNKSDDGGNARAAKNEVEDAHAGLSQIEFMYAQPAQENAQKAGGDFAFIGPAGVNVIVVDIIVGLLVGLLILLVLLLIGGFLIGLLALGVPVQGRAALAAKGRARFAGGPAPGTVLIRHSNAPFIVFLYYSNSDGGVNMGRGLRG